LTYTDAVDWAIDNVPMPFYDSYDEWLNASKSELQTPELTNHPEFNKQMQQAWTNEVGDITKTRQQLEQEEREQRRLEEFEEPVIEEPEVVEPTAKQVEQDLERNIPEVIQAERPRDFLTQEKSGALAEVLKSLPKGSKISIPQPKGAPIDIKPSVTFPTGITMTRPPITAVRTPFTPIVSAVASARVAIKGAVSTVAKGVRTGIRVIFRI
jgi:hypothetical protein